MQYDPYLMFGSIDPIRFGMIVPSSNVTLERELSAMARAREATAPERFSFHTARVRLRSVIPETLHCIHSDAIDAAAQLADAAVDVIVYGSVIGVMAEGPAAHRDLEVRLTETVTASGGLAPVITAAGALVDTLQSMHARRVGLIAPYLPELTQKVCAYLQTEGVEVVGSHSLSVASNSAVGRLDQCDLLAMVRKLPRDVDAVVLSACVQMPSLSVIEAAEARLGVPVISATTATMYQALRRLGLTPQVPGAGRLLSAKARPRRELAPVG